MALELSRLFASNAHWGRWFKSHLKAIGLTQKQVAACISVKPETVSRWGQGKHFPRMRESLSVKLAECLGVHIDLLPYGHLVGDAASPSWPITQTTHNLEKFL